MKGFLGWVILAVALAVPAFMFWNWWQAMNQGRLEGGRRLVSGGVFSAVSSAARLSNPIVTSTQTAAVLVSTGTIAPAPTASPEPLSGPAPALTAPAAPSAAQAAALSTAPARTAAGGDEAFEYKPQTSRDPMLSPNDVKRLAKLHFEKDMALRDVKVEVKRPAPSEPPIESRLTLMGIIQTPRGTTVIINDRILKVGDSILGARIIRVSSSHVDFSYKNRAFRKTIQK